MKIINSGSHEPKKLEIELGKGGRRPSKDWRRPSGKERRWPRRRLSNGRRPRKDRQRQVTGVSSEVPAAYPVMQACLLHV
jgi:hypothetical protein